MKPVWLLGYDGAARLGSIIPSPFIQLAVTMAASVTAHLSVEPGVPFDLLQIMLVPIRLLLHLCDCAPYRGGEKESEEPVYV